MFRLPFPLDVFLEWILLDSNRPAQEQWGMSDWSKQCYSSQISKAKNRVGDSIPCWFCGPISNLWDNQVSLLSSVFPFSKFLISQYFTMNRIFSERRQVGKKKRYLQEGIQITSQNLKNNSLLLQTHSAFLIHWGQRAAGIVWNSLYVSLKPTLVFSKF